MSHKGSRKKKKTLIIGLDGCRPDALLAAETRHMGEMIRTGAFCEDAQADEITVSGPSWSTLLTGVPSSRHGVLDNDFETNDLDRFPHFFRRLKEVSPETVTETIVTWSPINESITTHADRSLEPGSDERTAEEVHRTLREQDADVLFLQLDDIDAAGHRHIYSPDSPGYLESIHAADRQIGLILEGLAGRPARHEEDWLIVVTTDHGGSGTSHGKNIPEHRDIFLLLSGDSVAPGRIPSPSKLEDVVPTVFGHMGLPIDPEWGWEGRVLPILIEAE